MVGVDDITLYLTVKMGNVIRTGKIRVVLKIGKRHNAITITLPTTVVVLPVWTMVAYTESGENQKVNKNGDTTRDVVVNTLSLMVHLLNAIQTGSFRVAAG